MHTISLNVDRWSLIDYDYEESALNYDDVIALVDDISYANCDHSVGDDGSLWVLDAVHSASARSAWRAP